MQNPFKPQTAEEKVEKELQRAKIDTKVKELAQTARELLAEPRYVEFRKGYQEIREKLVQILINYDKGKDFREFSAVVIKIQERIKMLDNFIKMPHDVIAEESKMEDLKKQKEE